VPALLHADVRDTSATGFTVENMITVSAPAGTVFDKLTHDIGVWWDPAHTWSGSASNLSLDPTAGGLFKESLPGGGSVTHLEVVYADRGNLLRLRGALGPLQSMAVTGSLTWTLTEQDGKTIVRLTYAVTGYAPSGLAFLAEPVDGVLRTQLNRFRSYMETGKP